MAAITIGALVFTWTYVRTREPEYSGHPVTYWISYWEYSRHESAASVEAAYAAMDDRAVRWLEKELFWRPSVLWKLTARTLNRIGDFMSDEDTQNDLRPQAAMALMRLGERAHSAIPSLEKAAMSPAASGRDWSARTMALAALIKLRGDRLEPYWERTKTAGLDEAASLVGAIGWQGTNAQALVPALVAELTNTHPRGFIVSALGSIHSRPDLSVPALVPYLNGPDLRFRDGAILALAQFGPDGKPAWSNLMACLADTNHFTRYLATNALRTIDPAAAGKLGIN